ncbi:MAG: GIY-YIG nuclease family protein [Nanoarchaeota archaeon]|nr:GIY-YIG nuclease family protein [Nanoarchaeota archaeon]
MKEIFQKGIRPQIYAYTTSQYKEMAWTGEKCGNGLLKIGYTEKDVEERIWSQFPTMTPEDRPFEIVFKDDAVDKRGKFFKDHFVHKKLEKKGFRRVRGEWFECTEKDLKNAILEIKMGVEVSEKRHQNFKMRPEQAEAVKLTKEYFKKCDTDGPCKAKHFLWNAKMRFGKTFTSYQLAKKMGWRRVIVLTYKPAVAGEWKENLLSHVDFEGWQFVDRENTFNKVSEKKPVVWFASFQDILGRDKDGKIKQRFEYAKKIDWDCVILDEYHFGAWREAAKDFYTGEIAKETDLDERIKAEEEFAEERFPLKVEHFLYLSGTPFRAVATGEFNEDQIYNWSYADEQRAKTTWDERNGDNPYAELPQIAMMTYQLPERVREMAMQTGQDEFSLNEFFKAKKVETNGEVVYIFEHENEVQKWLNIIRGQESIFSPIAGQKNVRPPIPFEDVRLLSYLNHTLWFLPSVASCKAMAKLLNQRSNDFFKNNYEIIVAAGPEAGIGLAAVAPVKEKIGNGLKSKTITLTCGKLTTGITMPQWSGIFFLRDTTSPETYFQAAFRVQSPWAMMNVDGFDPQKKEVIKPLCYIFDFAPNRALNLIAEYSSRLDLNETRSAEKRVSDFLNFLPVLCYDGSSMQSLNAIELLDIAVTGVASSMLARRWQSAQLIDVGTITLGRLLDNPDIIQALEKIEAFRNLNKNIKKIISSEHAINKLKKEEFEKSLTKTKKRELSEKEKEIKGIRKQLREKLLKFVTRIPVFMYLTDFREETLKDVITNIEPDLFTKVTGLTVFDFEKMCEIGVFNSQNMNSAIFAFKRFESYSLVYAGGRELKGTDIIGGFDAKVRRDELNDVIEGVIK